MSDSRNHFEPCVCAHPRDCHNIVPGYGTYCKVEQDDGLLCGCPEFQECTPPTVKSTSILDEAAGLIDGDRKQTYGDVHDSFGRIAGLWTAYTGTTISGLDVANMMILLKMSRTKGTFHRDSYVDTCGYAALAERLHTPKVADDA